MYTIMWLAAVAVTLGVHSSPTVAVPDATAEVLALERASLEGWRTGDPEPSLAICDPSITYFHVMTRTRLDGLPAVKALWETYRGRPLFDRFEILEPRVQQAGEVSVLTYILLQQNGAVTARWNATQVYRRQGAGWRVIHSHWSQTAASPGSGS